MTLEDSKTGKNIPCNIKLAEPSELKALKGSQRFTFDWSKEITNLVYKIHLENHDEILGLISIIDYPKEFRIHINLIESAKEHRGKGKKLRKIGGCLIAFACRLAFQKGYDGFVSLIPKTYLINFYKEKYGFQPAGNQMAVFLDSARALTNKYL